MLINLLNFFLLYSLFSLPAYAYIDPGSSLLLLQGLFAAIGAAFIFAKSIFRILSSAFRKLFGLSKDPSKDIDA